MKKIIITMLAMALFTSLLVGSAGAAFITGTIELVGGFTPGPTNDLATATSINFNDNKATLDEGTGSFSTIPDNTEGTINDFVFNPFPASGVTPLWDIGGFTFDLLAITFLAQSSSILGLEGTGILKHASFEDTIGNWVLTGNTAGEVAGVQTFSWSSSNGGTAPIPEPATMILLGAGLVGLVGSRIRKKK